jgi:hypothetical protein
MAKKKTAARSNEKSPAGGKDWKRLISAGAVLFAVGAVLVLGAVLQAGPESDSGLPDEQYMELDQPPAGAEPSGESLSAPVPAPSSAAPSPERPRGLAARAGDDRARLARPGGDWTLQFMYSCDPANVHSLLAALGASDELYVIRKDACYRLCWGRYDSRDAAVARREAVARASGVSDKAIPRRTVGVLE